MATSDGHTTDSAALVVVPGSTQDQNQPLGVLGATKILIRWSPLVIPLIAISLYFAVNLTSSVQPEFTAQASLLLTGPNELQFTDFDTGELFIEEVNPLNELGGSLPTVAEVTALSLTDSETLIDLEDRGLAVVFNVWNGTRSPIINAEAVDSDPEIAERTVAYLLRQVEVDLEARQDALDAPLTQRITAEPIDAVSVSDPDFAGRTRTRIGLATVGIALSIASAFVFEGLRQLIARSRARRRLFGESGLEASSTNSDRFTVANTDQATIDRTEEEKASAS